MKKTSIVLAAVLLVLLIMSGTVYAYAHANAGLGLCAVSYYLDAGANDNVGVTMDMLGMYIGIWGLMAAPATGGASLAFAL